MTTEPNPPHRLRTPTETTFGRWMDASKLHIDKITKALGVQRSAVYRWRQGVRRPVRTLAVKIEKFTKGAVPVSAWDDVPKARKRKVKP